MDEEGEEPFVALDSLLEVNLIEDAPALGKGDSFKGYRQESNGTAENAVESSVSCGKNTGLNSCMPSSNFDAVQIAWGMDSEEDAFYKDLFKDVSTVQYLRLHCTACDAHLGCKPGSVLMRHVRLGTLLCKDCFTFYGAGDFPVAEDGSESFCYWCGQGGNVICCSSCSAVFCKKCIKLNYTRCIIKEIEASNEWLCFVCNYRSLWEHRAVCRAAITYESSDHGSLKGDEATTETPGLDPQFCCTLERRLPRLKSNMPSSVTFGDYVKVGRVKVSVRKMLKNVSTTGTESECITLDSNETVKSEKTVSADTQNNTLSHSAASKEMINNEQCVTASHSNKTRNPSMLSHNVPYVNVGPVTNQIRFSSVNSQQTTGLRFINHGIRSNIVNNNTQAIPRGRVVVMPALHIPQRNSVVRLPVAGAMVGQQSSPVDTLSLGALLSSSPPVGSVLQQPNPVIRFQNGTSPFVVLSDSNRLTGVPVVVRNSSGSYVPMYVNNSANFHCIPKDSSQVRGIPDYIQNKNTSAISHSDQREKSENNITFPDSSDISNAATYQCKINGHTSQIVSKETLAHTEDSNVKAKAKSGYIQVRSPTALQSVTVSDIEHSYAVPEQQSIHDSLLPGSPAGTVPSAPTSFSTVQSMHNFVDSHLIKSTQNKLATRPTSSATSLEGTSALKNILTDVSPLSGSYTQNTSEMVAGSCNPVNETSSSKDILQAHVVNQTCPELPSRSIDAIETKWFKQNLMEAENVAKYMLTRITCVQEELDSKTHVKQAFDEIVNHFSKLLEISSKKITDVNRNFTANLKKWNALSSSCHSDHAQGSRANADKQSNVETENRLRNSTVDEEVEVISVNVRGERGRRKSSNSEHISTSVTCTTEGSSITQLATSSVTDSSEPTNKIADHNNITYQPTRMLTRRSKGCRTTSKCCIGGCKSDLQSHKKHVDVQQNTRSSLCKSKRLLEQAKYHQTPEKRRKLKEVRIVLERINNPCCNMNFKRELDDSNAKLVESVEVVKDQSCLGPDALLKQLKPCSVVIPRLNQRDITHCI